MFSALESHARERFASHHKQPDQQIVCRDCARVEFHLNGYRSHQPLPTQRDAYQPPGLRLHSSFQELNQCAQELKCASCRIFRQALLVSCGSSLAAEKLIHSTSQHSVQAAFEFLPGDRDTTEDYVGPNILVGMPDLGIEAILSLSPSATDPPLNLASDPIDKALLQQIQQWLHDCDKTHFDSCASLRYSSKNPTRLVRLSEEGLSLVETASKDRLQYVALSYPWGQYTDISESQKVEISAGKTTLQNLSARCEKLNLCELPATIRDAITLTGLLKITYIWIDALCIIQDSEPDKNQEIPKMHQYYGNAYLTLCVCSTTKASESFLYPREAWSLDVQPCRLSGQWLTPRFDLNTILSLAPLSSRAWTLQEEILSPRILYWTAQRVYWSCGAHERPEEGESQESVTSGSQIDLVQRTNFAQSFLRSLADGAPGTQISRRWRKIVESYSRRDISIPQDTFPALAGLAARYLHTQSDAYLAGLWEGDLASGLAWTVKSPGDMSKARKAIAPTWSWASLPTKTPTAMYDPEDSPRTNFWLDDWEDPVPVEGAVDPVSVGARVRKIQVHGRMRAFRPKDAIPRPWETVSRWANSVEQFYFDKPEQAVIAAKTTQELVLAYEVRRRPVIVQLDYQGSSEKVLNGEIDLMAFEVRDDAMLLIEANEDRSTYRRVGAAVGYRNNFFEWASSSSIWLE